MTDARTTVAKAAIHLVSLALLISVTLADENGYTISYFTCNDTWNPSVLSNSRTQLQSICHMKLLVTAIQNETSQTECNTKAATLSLLVTTGTESLRSGNIVGVDYWIAMEKSVQLDCKGTTDVNLNNWELVFPNICGQTYLIARVVVDGITTDLAIPIQLECREKSVDLALVGQTKDEYNMYNQRPVIHTTNQPIAYFIPGLKLLVDNVGFDTFTARSGLSSFSVVAYLKYQQWNMFHFDFKNQSHQYQGDKSIFEYQLGDVLLKEGSDLVPIQSGRGTPSLASNYSLELKLDNLTLNSKDICGNAVLVFQLKVPFYPTDYNNHNDIYYIPVFVDCYEHSPVQNTESCQVVPNYYDGGQTAYIAYSNAGQKTVYEYKADDRSVRKMTDEQDKFTLQEVAEMQLQIEIQSKRLMQSGHCVDTLWGSVDCFVTLLDAVLANVRSCWDAVKPENSIQTNQYSKLKLILDTVCDVFTLMLQPKHPLHEYLIVPFQAAFNPYYPNHEGFYSSSYYESNRVKRDANDINSVEHEFKTAAVNEAMDHSIPMPTTSSPPLTDDQTVQHNNSSTETTANLPGTSREAVPTTVTVTVPRTNTAAYTTASFGYSQETTSIPKTTATPESFTSKPTATTPPLSTQEKTTVADVTQSLTGTQRSSTVEYEDSSFDAESAFGPKAEWHEIVSGFINKLIMNGGENLYVLSKERWHALSVLCKSFLYGRTEDYARYPYIPVSLKYNLHTLVSMFANQNGPRMFDNIPKPLMDTFNEWFNTKRRYRRDFGHASCDYQEGISLVLNKTEELLENSEMSRYKDVLKLIAYICEVLSKDDNTNYYAKLYSQLFGEERRGRTWMMRDDIPIHEPCKEDVYKRCTAAKQWQFKRLPVFQFGSKIMSPDHYNSVFWSNSNGSIMRGDRSDLTGQVLWSKVATCNCPNGASCDRPTSSTTPSGDSSRSMAAAVIKNEAEVAIEARHTNSNQKQDVEAAEDMLFSN
ncbi:hypothetical protein CHUAL_003274 [Chamberlinius hualienensis]